MLMFVFVFVLLVLVLGLLVEEPGAEDEPGMCTLGRGGERWMCGASAGRLRARFEWSITRNCTIGGGSMGRRSAVDAERVSAYVGRRG